MNRADDSIDFNIGFDLSARIFGQGRIDAFSGFTTQYRDQSAHNRYPVLERIFGPAGLMTPSVFRQDCERVCVGGYEPLTTRSMSWVDRGQEFSRHSLVKAFASVSD